LHINNEGAHMRDIPWVFLIPIVAIIGGLAIGAFAMLTEHRRRMALLEERRLMIEKGMTPPPLDSAALSASGSGSTTPEASLRSGIVLVAVGVGLLGAFLITRWLVLDTPLPDHVVAMTAPAGVIVMLIGLGNLIYYGIARRKAGASM
jgi:hypothetical protein